MLLSEIHIRDPFILLFENNYYLYGTSGDEAVGKSSGFYAYKSTDLVNWEGKKNVFSPPEGFWADRDFWAPEVHYYNGKFYMLASFKKSTGHRGTQILVSESPLGPFREHSKGPLTPADWECLDGTLWVEDGVPYMIFCHEWTQIIDGTVCLQRLTDDLSDTVGAFKVLFRASQSPWAKKNEKKYVTDGPFIYKLKNGELIMIWSSYFGHYAEAMLRSRSGSVKGPWEHEKRLLFSDNGGHGMIFKDLSGSIIFTLHSPNNSPLERAVLFELEEKDNSLYVLKEK